MKKAESLYNEALLTYENVLGVNHPDTAISYSNLSITILETRKI